MAMIVMAALGLYFATRNGHGKRIVAMYSAQLVVGLGSTAFHATLKYTTQLLDELPMLYLCAIGFYAVVEMDRDVRYGAKVPLAIGAVNVAITLVYLLWLQNPVFHQATFALTAFATVFFGYKRLREMDVACATRRLLFRLNLFGYLGMLSGFLAWNVDNLFCHRLRSYRAYVGAPWDALLQLHGWWHILTAYGSTSIVLWVHMLRLARLREGHLYSIHYFLGVFPYVDRQQPKKVD
ncbi:alkaline ceramidase ydc1 [Coemansia nantahalensis]|uniref:Alkaline ceramidase ydc1 n=2 Tax=Coemansia TaxID=4863 RepID=A0ACC1LCP3_9FUNG|nr:alkaline ceramidase ydc1 [Coemansia nantahalensis]KAJ2805467.1 alkaline ceramidase ydc1 [Coemansia helicoidea]